MTMREVDWADTWAEQIFDRIRDGCPDEQVIQELAKNLRRARFVAPSDGAARPELLAPSSIVVCVRCGSLIDYGGGLAGSGSEHTCQWCPACSPERPWRRGRVVDESRKAHDIRYAQPEPVTEEPAAAKGGGGPHSPLPLAVNQPPSCPTSLGTVWTGVTMATPEVLAAAMGAAAAAAVEERRFEGFVSHDGVCSMHVGSTNDYQWLCGLDGHRVTLIVRDHGPAKGGGA